MEENREEVMSLLEPVSGSTAIAPETGYISPAATQSSSKDILGKRKNPFKVVKKKPKKNRATSHLRHGKGRDMWNMGQGHKIRSTADGLQHAPQKNAAVARAKCLVCCMRCKLGKHEASGSKKSREGYQTVKSCYACALSALEMIKKNSSDLDENELNALQGMVKPVPLCTTRRFTGDPRTCWEIHHSNTSYPALHCCGNEKPRDFPKLKGADISKAKGKKVERKKKVPGEQTTAYGKRDLWNMGEGAEIRSKSIKGSTAEHRPEKNDTVKTGRAKCIVCCFRCSKSQHDGVENREGYKTAWCCKTCFKQAATNRQKDPDVKTPDERLNLAIPLCRVPRFEDDPRTCWEIHHSTEPYPPLPCTKDEKPRKFKWNCKKTSNQKSLKFHVPKKNATAKTGRAKCVVCCFRCNKGAHGNFAFKEGYKTAWACDQCSHDALMKKRVQEGIPLTNEITEAEKRSFKPVALCRVPRFEGDPRSCWEIHHSDEVYPLLGCHKTARAQKLLDHRAVKNTSVAQGRAKCAICCMRCKKGSHDTFEFREGYKTPWACYQCATIKVTKQNSKKENNIPGPGDDLLAPQKRKPIALCRVARFDGDPRTCWDIYHSGDKNYPMLSCSKTSKKRG